MPTKTNAEKAKKAELTKLGTRIKETRLGRGLTQRDLAEALGISIAYMSLLERGGRNPPITTVLAIEQALRVPPGRLSADG